MKTLGRLILALAVIGLGFWLWKTFFPDDAQLIHKHLAATAKAASVSGNESALARLGSIAELGDCFTPDVEMKFDVPRQGHFEVSGRDEILGLAARVRASGRSITVEFLDVTVLMSDDKLAATAGLTLRVKIPGDDNFTVQEMKFSLKKLHGRWLINRVETVKTLSHAETIRIAANN